MNLSGDAVIGRIKALGLPQGSFVVIGSGILAALGIRQTSDIDLAADGATYEMLAAESREWTEEDTGHGLRLMSSDGVIEVWRDWSPAPSGDWSVEELLRDAVVIDGVAFVSLERVRRWKLWRGREKDLRDVALIDAYRKESEAKG